jgi:hypothetical protein
VKIDVSQNSLEAKESSNTKDMGYQFLFRTILKYDNIPASDILLRRRIDLGQAIFYILENNVTIL